LLKFSTGSFFDIDNDFKSQIKIDLNKKIFIDYSSKSSKQIIKEKTIAKKRLLSYFSIEPKVDVLVDDVILYDKYALVNLNLKPKTKYTIKNNLKTDFEKNKKSLEKVSKVQKDEKVFTFTTPENKYL
jgi:ribosomal protein S17E